MATPTAARTADVTVHRGLSRFSRRKGRRKRIDVLAAKMGLSPLHHERGQSLFSADVFCAKRDFPPKNGPVPIQAVNAYPRIGHGSAIRSLPI